MEEKKNRQKVVQVVEQELRRDRAPSKAVQVSDFGLIIVTRKRVKQSLERLLTDQCPYCSGTGTIKSSATICHEILTEMRKVARELDGAGRRAARESRHRAALQDEERDVLRGDRARRRPQGDDEGRRPAAPRAVRRDGEVRPARRLAQAGPRRLAAKARALLRLGDGHVAAEAGHLELRAAVTEHALQLRAEARADAGPGRRAVLRGSS